MDVSGDVTIRRVVRAVSLLFVLASLVVTCTVPVSAGGPVSAPERAALVDLWNGLGGLSAQRPNWLVGDPCINFWVSVQCSSAPAVT